MPKMIRILAVAGVSVAAVLSGSALAAEPALNAIRIAGAGPILGVNLPEWSQAPPAAVPMEPQEVAVPTNPNAAVKELKVRAAHNGQWLAVLIEWQDPTKSDRIVVDRFGDQVAVEFPIKYDKDDLPSPTMGQAGGRVNILQWRAAFQRDLDEGEPTVRDLYPNAVVDLYPDQVLRASDARPYSGALGVDNPISRPKESAVLDQMAEGWGTMTVKPDQHADGHGVWDNGTWRVVITLPMASGSANSPLFSPGAETVAAFAVWEGGNREVGARKAWSNWVPLGLSK
ncbi:MAG: ethylbenzene dehydrogenase-related protein [Pseudomonadota bacterium]